MIFDVALHLIAEAERLRIVFLATQVALDRVSGDHRTAAIAGDLKIPADVVVEDLQAGLIVAELGIAADLGPLNGARVADELLDPQVAADEGVLDVDEVGAFSLDVSENQRVARRQGAAFEQNHFARDRGAREPATRGDAEITADQPDAIVAAAVHVLRRGAEGSQADRKNYDGR